MIYELCLLHDGEIVPHPTTYERDDTDFKGCRPAEAVTYDALYPTLQPVSTAFPVRQSVTYSKRWPSVALLGVNKAIQHEAAIILFGKNVWRISETELSDCNHMWEIYNSYFQQIVTSFDMRDVTPRQLMDVTDNILGCGNIDGEEEKFYEDDDAREYTHKVRIEKMREIWKFKRDMLEGMQLKSLVLDIRNLFCPGGCCRVPIINQLCLDLKQRGPWYKLKPNLEDELVDSHKTDIEAKRLTNVKVVGLRHPKEARLIRQRWGLDLAALLVRN